MFNNTVHFVLEKCTLILNENPIVSGNKNTKMIIKKIKQNYSNKFTIFLQLIL